MIVIAGLIDLLAGIILFFIPGVIFTTIGIVMFIKGAYSIASDLIYFFTKR